MTAREGGGFFVVTGDSPRILMDHMCGVFRSDPVSPFADEIIVVQSLGMERWVRQQLALQLGCAASLRLPFPAAFCRDLSGSLRPGEAIDESFEQDRLVWRLFSLLGERSLSDDPANAMLVDYLGDGDASRRYGLARRLAASFDEYRLYRPQMLLDWESGGGEQWGSVASENYLRWQRNLWVKLVGDTRPAHFARWFLSTIEQLERAAAVPEGLPERISVFGISTLPPLFVRLLKAVSRFVPVYFHVLVPDAESWRFDLQLQHPLFARFGRASQELLDTLDGVSPRERFELRHLNSALPADDSLLHHVQRGLRQWKNGSTDANALRLAVAAEDSSIGIHLCHSPLREVEVLRDCILDAFSADPTLRPHDVLVMVPDVETYAPLVESVFAKPPVENGPVFPISVADRSRALSSDIYRAFERFLDLATSRLGAAQVMQLLAMPPVARGVDLSSAELERLGARLDEAGIIWGWDGAERAREYQVVPFEENAWRQGIDRMLTGYAVGPAEELVGGLLPVAGDMPGDAQMLGRFVEWVEALHLNLVWLRSDHTIADWIEKLTGMLSWLVVPDESVERNIVEELTAIIRSLGDLTADAYHPADAGSGVGGGASHTVHLAVIRDWLGDTMGGERHSTRFLVGGATVCAMKPMRAIPHRFIAMLGMDDSSFPRKMRRHAFDLITASPKPGDRDARADDRQLMLDNLLCASDRLHISWTARSQVNNSEIASSIVIAELQEYLHSITGAEVEHSHPWLKVEHKLQPYNREYFVASGTEPNTLFSYDAGLAASVAASSRSESVPPFVNDTVLSGSVPVAVPRANVNVNVNANSGVAVAAAKAAGTIPAEDENILEISLSNLAEIWINPSRFHLRHTLGVSLPDVDEIFRDVEPLEVSPLMEFKTRAHLLAAASGSGSRETDRILQLASGYLPPRALGDGWYDKLANEMAPLLNDMVAIEFTRPLNIDLRGEDEHGLWRITGLLDGQSEDAQYRVWPARKPGAKGRVYAWVAHLLRAASGLEGMTHVWGTDVYERRVLAPITAADARQELTELVAVYRRVLVRPIPYFINSVEAYRKNIESSQARLSPMDAARKKWKAPEEKTDLDNGPHDMNDPYVALLWKGRSPLDECEVEFKALADTFWEPLTRYERGAEETGPAAASNGESAERSSDS